MTQLVLRLAAHPLVCRFGKFGAVGASGVIVNSSLLWVLTHSLNLHYLVASPLAIEAALCSNYILNNNWTFFDRRLGFVSWTGFARYHVVSMGGMLINVGVLHVLASGPGAPVMVANLIGIAIATIWNFSLSVGWTWSAIRIDLGASSSLT